MLTSGKGYFRLVSPDTLNIGARQSWFKFAQANQEPECSFFFVQPVGKSYRYYLSSNRVRFKLGFSHKLIAFFNTYIKHVRKYRFSVFSISKNYKRILVALLSKRAPNTYSKNGIKHLFLNKVFKQGKLSSK